MTFVTVQIVRFVDDSNPGWVECEFADSAGRRHVFIEKAPIVTSEDLSGSSVYPRPGCVRCEVLRRYRDENGVELVTVTTARPDDIESIDGLSEFTVAASAVTAVSNSR